MRPKDKDGLAVIAALREAEAAIGAAMQCAARTMDTIDTLRVRVDELEGLAEIGRLEIAYSEACLDGPLEKIQAAPHNLKVARRKYAALPAAEQAVVPLLDDWLLFADDIQPACAAGQDWLDSLRARTQIALDAAAQARTAPPEVNP